MDLPAYSMRRLLGELRRDRGKDVDDVVRALEMDFNEYEAAERGEAPFPPEKLPALARVYGLDERRLWLLGTAAYGMWKAMKGGAETTSEEVEMEDYGRVQELLRPGPAFHLPDRPGAREVYKRFVELEKPKGGDFRSLREATGLSLVRYSELTGFPYGTMRFWERGVAGPSARRLESLRAACREYLAR